MHVNTVGQWAVVWVTRKQKLAYAFFFSQLEAQRFQAQTGGEFYQKLDDGSLKRT